MFDIFKQLASCPLSCDPSESLGSKIHRTIVVKTSAQEQWQLECFKSTLRDPSKFDTTTIRNRQYLIRLLSTWHLVNSLNLYLQLRKSNALTNMLVNLPTNLLQIEFLIEAHSFANILLNLHTHHWGNRILDTCSQFYH